MKGQLGGAFGSCTYSKRIGVKQPFDDINRALCIVIFLLAGVETNSSILNHLSPGALNLLTCLGKIENQTTV